MLPLSEQLYSRFWRSNSTHSINLLGEFVFSMKSRYSCWVHILFLFDNVYMTANLVIIWCSLDFTESVDFQTGCACIVLKKSRRPSKIHLSDLYKTARRSTFSCDRAMVSVRTPGVSETMMTHSNVTMFQSLHKDVAAMLIHHQEKVT